MPSYCTHFENGRSSLDLDEKDHRCRSGDRSGGVQHDAQRAMIRIGINRVDMRHLNHGEQCKQRQTQQHSC